MGCPGRAVRRPSGRRLKWAVASGSGSGDPWSRTAGGMPWGCREEPPFHSMPASRTRRATGALPQLLQWHLNPETVGLRATGGCQTWRGHSVVARAVLGDGQVACGAAGDPLSCRRPGTVTLGPASTAPRLALHLLSDASLLRCRVRAVLLARLLALARVLGWVCGAAGCALVLSSSFSPLSSPSPPPLLLSLSPVAGAPSPSARLGVSAGASPLWLCSAYWWDGLAEAMALAGPHYPPGALGPQVPEDR